MKILLVEPAFPIPPKSKNHKDFLPIGLLKLAAKHRSDGDKVKLIRGNKIKKQISKNGVSNWYIPDKIFITSLFTYWKPYVEETVNHYNNLFPTTEITVGGIYASLMPDDCRQIKGVTHVWEGLDHCSEKFFPAYDLIETNPHPIDYQIFHTSRGCDRHCSFCGTWRIEPEFISKDSVKNDVKFKKLIFYDNNFLMNPYVDNLLNELIELKKQKTILWCESQSGFDGRLLVEKPSLAVKLKKAGFRYPRIAWDWNYKDYPNIKNQIDVLAKAGYNQKEIYVFVLYNWKISFDEMEKKRIKCYEWGVQISDCRYRPLNQTYDNYNPRKKGQTKNEYYIHNNWTDAEVKQFRKNVREQNICTRHGFPFYSRLFEHKANCKDVTRKIKKSPTIEEKKIVMDDIGIDYWFPGSIRNPST